MVFWNTNKEITSKEYTDLLGKISTLTNEIGIIKGQVASLETHMASLRGIVNRKLGRLESVDEDGANSEKKFTKQEVKDLLTGLGIQWDGSNS